MITLMSDYNDIITESTSHQDCPSHLQPPSWTNNAAQSIYPFIKAQISSAIHWICIIDTHKRVCRMWSTTLLSFPKSTHNQSAWSCSWRNRSPALLSLLSRATLPSLSSSTPRSACASLLWFKAIKRDTRRRSACVKKTMLVHSNGQLMAAPLRCVTCTDSRRHRYTTC